MKQKELKKNLPAYGGFFDITGKEEHLSRLSDQIESDPNFWSNPEKSAPILKEKKVLEVALNRAKRLTATKEDLDAALELAAEEDDYLAESHTLLATLESELKALEVESLLGAETDINDAILTINAGAGGTESCDWSSMLMRQYLRYAERKGWDAEVIDILDGEGAGIKNVTIGIKGPYAYGLLKAESGVHRLVRISPFDSNARRHTSFSSVFVTPVVDDSIVIDINPSDLKIDTFRASGAGGQHVNKTDSAVRITHMPTGIIVQSQNQRSQHQNKDTCMKLMRSALYERELEERRKTATALEATKSDNSWGSQIRSYVLHPYQLVKDHRTEIETSDSAGFLDGNIEPFINEFLVKTRVPG